MTYPVPYFAGYVFPSLSMVFLWGINFEAAKQLMRYMSVVEKKVEILGRLLF